MIEQVNQVNLEAASTDELKYQLDKLKNEQRVLAKSVAYIKTLIAKRLSKYDIGDILMDHRGRQFLLTRVDFTYGSVDYFGRMLKKDGTPGLREYHISIF